jgi:glycosyltransferase involved in cell wall biosynthesis
MNVAFYAPMKPPDHPHPSGDRLMARQIMHALQAGGHVVHVASRLRSWRRDVDPAWLRYIGTQAEAETSRLLAGWHRDPAHRPDAWLTYHLYYRAPDLIGPRVAARLRIPYIAVEASWAPARADGPWAEAARHAAAALRDASLLLAMTRRDLQGLMGMPGRRGACALFLPFLADPGTPPAPRPLRTPVVLATVAMMRTGTKHRSYELLAAALADLPARPDWRLVVVGDGAEGQAVRALLTAAAGSRVDFAGLLDPPSVRAVLDAADVFVWPGHREPYGMVYLEAAASGLPVVAMRSGGVPDVVDEGRTALLSADLDVPALAANVARLIGDAALRAHMGAAGRAFVVNQRGLAQAAAILDGHLHAALAQSSPPS